MTTIHPINLWFSLAYLIETPRGLILVDAGSAHQETTILRRMRSISNADLKLIFLTHAHLDHYGSAAALKKATGAPVAIHSDDATALTRGESPLGPVRSWGKLGQPFLPLLEDIIPPQPLQADILLEDGDSLYEFGLEATVLHTPGHTPGSSCLLVEGVSAFVGDLLSNHLWPHVQNYFAVNWDLIPISLSRLKATHPRWVYPGHGRQPISGETLQSL